jgi:hypothetical protein
MPVFCRKSLVIGLGGTGIRSALYMKKMFLEQFGEVPEIIQIRCFDTTDATRQQAEEETGVKFEPGREFILIEVTQLRDLIPVMLASPDNDLKSWFPQGKVRMSDILSGCGQERPSGRVALHIRADQILGSLRQAYAHVRDVEVADLIRKRPDLGVTNSQVTNAFIICSIAGGTGGGMFLDLAYFLRTIMGENDRIIGILLLPTIFSSLPPAFRPYILGNTYASLKELDYWMTKPEKERQLRYSKAESVRWGGVAPFTHVFLVDSENERGEVITEKKKLWSFLGKSLSILITAEAQQTDILDNMQRMIEGDPWLGQKYPKYMGMGMSILEIPLQELSEVAQYEVVLELIRDGLLTSAKKGHADQEVQSFIEAQEIQKDQLLNRLILSGAELPVDVELQRPVLPEVSTEKRGDAVINWLEEFRSKIENGFAGDASRKGNDVYKKTTDAITAKVKTELLQPGGVEFTYHFLATLAERFKNIHDQLEHELAGQGEQRGFYEKRKLEIAYPARDRIEEAARRQWRFPPYAPLPIETIIEDCIQELRKEGKLIAEIKRREEAKEVVSRLKQFTEDYQTKIKELEQALKNAIKETITRIDDLNASLSMLDPLAVRLERVYVEKQLKDIARQISVRTHVFPSVHSDALMAWRDLRAADIVAELKNLIAPEFASFEQLALGTIIGAMDDMNKDQLAKDLRAFVDKAVPYWRIGDPAGQGNIGQFIIFCAPSEDRASVFDGYIRRRIGLGAYADHTYAASKDKRRYYALTCKASVPAYLLQKIRDYYNDYQRRESKRHDFTHHVHKDWASLPEVLPQELLGGITEQQLAERLRVWTIAQAKPFELVKKQGRHYVVRSEKKGSARSDYWVRLAPGRVEAWERFASDEFNEVFDELDQAIDRIMAKEGNRKVIAGLLEHLRTLKDWKPVEPKLDEQVRQEFDALRRFIQELISDDPELIKLIEPELVSLFGGSHTE